jgi:hypothetical protein
MQRARAADTRLPLLALSARLFIGLFVLGGAAALLSSPAGTSELRPVVYTASATAGEGGSLAQLVPPGNTPEASAAGRDMTVSWAESFLTGGAPSTGYELRRYDTNGVEQTVLDGCSGILTNLYCTENSVPTGAWRYTVTPLFGSWTGTASLESATQVTSPATLTFASSTVNTLPATLSGTVTGFLTDEAITFHLDSETGPVLDGTPAAVPVGGSADVTVTIPAGTDNSPHSVFVVGDQGTLASRAIVVLQPPVLTTLEMFDTDANGKIDQVLATFSKTLATYTAGTTPWTLSGVPSGGTLTSVTVSGSTATLALAEGGGAADTAVGLFTIALADNAAGIRDAAAQTGSFAATAPTDEAAPAATLLQMLDNDGNGKVDSSAVTFSEQLDTYTAGNAPWTLSAVPSGGSLTSVFVSAATATLNLTEGAGAADTSVGSFTIALDSDAAGIRDTSGNLSSRAASVPVDKAKPVRLSMVMNDVNANGKVDQVAMTFSEILAAYSAGTAPWTLISVPSTATLASVTASGNTATLTLTEGAAAATTALGAFTVTLATNATGIRDAAANLSSWAATAPTDGAKPVLVSLNMNDNSLNGKVDQVTATFTETLGTTVTPTVAPWTLTGVPSGGALASVTVATTTATLTITEGAGAPDTTVGSFTLALAVAAGDVQDAAGNLSSFTTTAPLDKAKPARLSMVMNDVNANGKVDQVAMTFSETLATYTAGNTGWTLTSAPSTATLASVTASGTTATLNLNEGAAAATTALGSFKVTLATNAGGIRDAAANLTSWAATAPTDGAKPVLLSMNMNDNSLNGKVDQVTATFTETLGTTVAPTVAPWTLSGVPSGGSLTSVTVATTIATLTITEGAGAADTTVGAFTLALATGPGDIQDAAGNLSAFTAKAPLDKAKPARLSMVMNDVNANGKVDQVAMTFSETLAAYTAGNTGWTLTLPPSTATLASVAASGNTATLTLNEGPGAAATALGSFKITLVANAGGIRDAAGNLTSWASTAPTDGAAPALLTLNMNDANTNGKVDQVTAVFSETLGVYTAATAPWTLTGAPSGGTAASASVLTTTATLTITEGAGPADTTVGSMTVALASNSLGVKDAAGNLSSFGSTVPLDKAKPARVSMVIQDVNANGKIDQVSLSFSETLAPYTAGNTGWTLASAPSTDTLASVAAAGNTATLTLNEGAGVQTTAVGSFTIALTANAGGIRDAAANLTSWAAAAPTDGAKPVLLTLNMNDANANGKVDQVTAVFTETLGGYTAATAPWTLTGIPSGGTPASAAVATTTATLTITEGAGAADTTVGSMTVAMATNALGVKDAAGNLASFATAVPLDKAKPARVSMVIQDLNANGKIDQVSLTFSETLDTYTAGNTGWTFVSAPSGATMASVAASGTSATLTLNEGAGAPNTAVSPFTIALTANAGGIRDAAGNLTSWTAAAPTDGAAPVLVTLNMNDGTLNGKVDQVTAVFSETLGGYTAATAPWTVTGIPSGGTLASAAVATTTATLTITEGAGAADTTVGSMTVAMATNALGVKDAAGNLASFATSAPLDKAKPARLSILMNDVNGNGKVDQLAMTFSEALDNYTAGATPWTFLGAPSGATFGALTTSGSTATLNLVEGATAPNTAVGTFTVAMAANAAGIRDIAGNNTSWAATAPTDKAAPALVSMVMTDTNANGKVDHVTAVFSETLSAYTAGNAPWTLNGVPSGGALASVAILTTTATLTLNEGAGAADTTVGSFTIALGTSATGIRDAGSNLSSFATTTATDGAGPVATSVSSTGGATTGMIEAADTLTITFSEPLDPASVPTTVTVTESDPAGSGNDSLTITGITLGARGLGVDTYVTADGVVVDFPSSTVALSDANQTITITVGGTCQNTGCGGIGQALAAATFSFAPAASLTDIVGKPAAGTLSPVIRIF